MGNKLVFSMVSASALASVALKASQTNRSRMIADSLFSASDAVSDTDSERPFGQSPIPIEGRFLFRRHRIVRPLGRVFGAFFPAGVIAQPDLHVLLAPTAREIVKPTSARIAARQMRRVANAALRKLGIELAVAEVI